MGTAKPKHKPERRTRKHNFITVAWGLCVVLLLLIALMAFVVNSRTKALL